MASYSNTFNTNLKIFKLIGIGDLDTENQFKKGFYSFYNFFGISLNILFVVLQYFDLYFISNDVEKFNYGLCLTIATSVYLFKILKNRGKLGDIYRLRYDLNKKAEEEINEDYRKIYLKAEREMKLINKSFYVMNYCFIGVWWTSPLWGNENRVLPMRQWFPFDFQTSPYYEIAYSYQIISGIYLTTGMISLELVIFGFMMSLSAEYDILKDKIIQLGVWNKEMEDVEDSEILDKIKEIVRRHQEIIRKTMKFEKIFSSLNFLQFLQCATMLAVALLDVKLMSKEINGRFWVQLCYFQSVLFFIFFLCLYGARLQYKSYDIVEAVYGVPWFSIKPKFRRYLTLIITRAQNPPKVTGGKLMPLNFVTFSEVLRAAYSMLAFFSEVASRK